MSFSLAIFFFFPLDKNVWMKNNLTSLPLTLICDIWTFSLFYLLAKISTSSLRKNEFYSCAKNEKFISHSEEKVCSFYNNCCDKRWCRVWTVKSDIIESHMTIIMTEWMNDLLLEICSAANARKYLAEMSQRKFTFYRPGKHNILKTEWKS